MTFSSSNSIFNKFSYSYKLKFKIFNKMDLKKLIYIVLGIFVFQISTSYSQTTLKKDAGNNQPILTTNDGFDILSKAGDYALGFNAIPILCFVGNTFNANASNTFIGLNKFASNLGQNVIFGKYLLTNNSAIRAHFRFGTQKNVLYNNVTNDGQGVPDSIVTDKATLNNSCTVLGIGYEYRRGKGRVQGIYGGDVFIQRTGSKEAYEYANTYSLSDQAPTTTTNFVNGSSAPVAERLLSKKGGNSYGIGVRPFAGIEYFFASKVSIGGEFGWNILYSKTTKSESLYEYYDVASDKAVNKTKTNPSNNSWFIDTDNFNGALFLMFYF